MKKKKLNLDELRVESFITTSNNGSLNSPNIKGGTFGSFVGESLLYALVVSGLAVTSITVIGSGDQKCPVHSLPDMPCKFAGVNYGPTANGGINPPKQVTQNNYHCQTPDL